jgi:hypothetical protein
MNVWGSFRTAAVYMMLATVLLIAGVAYGVPVSQSPRVCYPLSRWGPAPDRYAPCVRIRKVYEDGSFQFAVSDHDGTVRYTSGVGAQDR